MERATTTPSVLEFTLKAVVELRRTSHSLTQSKKWPEPFLTTLGPLLSDVQARLEEHGHPQGPPTEKSVSQLLVVLENLWPGALQPIPKPPLKQKNYPELNRFVNVSQQNARTNIRLLATSSHKRAPAKRQEIQRRLGTFANVQRLARGPPLSDLVNGTNESVEDADYNKCLELLHKTLSKCLLPAEGCGKSLLANVALSRVQRLEGEPNDIFPFECFFLHRHADSEGSIGMWKEARVRVLLESDNPGRSSKVKWLHAEKISPGQFCEFILKPHRGRLLLGTADDGLVYERVDMNFKKFQELSHFLLDASSVSLATILDTRKLHGDIRIKLLLSFLLAKAVWKFYDSNWMTSNWTKDSIHFMREAANLSPAVQDVMTCIHRPYYATEFANQPPPETQNDSSAGQMSSSGGLSMASHCYPKILALGIMLLEIELGKGIEHFIKDNKPMENDDHYNAGMIISSDMWKDLNAFQAMKEIIEVCIKPDTGRLGDDISCARKNLYTHIVAPLERLFRQAWSDDGDPETFCPNPIYFTSADLTHESLESLCPSTPVNNYMDSAQSATFEPPAKTTSAVVARSVPQKNTDNWFRDFRALFVEHQILGQDQKKRIKVAVLDSGIDMKHPCFNSEDVARIEDVQSFIEDDKDGDAVGHGTHVAAIILRLTKNVNLYIGKITNQSIVSPRKGIAEALKVARTEWRVDMICLAFGFDGRRNPDDIGTEIRQCLHEDIMIFASASNDGGEGSRTYPAKYPQVISAYSTNCQGNKSAFNPSPEKGRNFSFVGEHVRPIWPLKTPKGSTKMEYKSGTSYATAVAVSIAAFMIDYIRKNWPDQNWGVNPESSNGIQKIFAMMAKERDGYDWVSPTRYFKEKEHPAMRFGDLLSHLR